MSTDSFVTSDGGYGMMMYKETIKGERMRPVTIPKVAMKIFPIGLGSNAIGGHNIYPNIDESTSKDIVREFIKQGGNFIDTAYFYGLGRSEELIGEVVKELDCRKDVVIATKASFIVDNGEIRHDNSIPFLERSIQEALSRLQTSYIDIFFVHFPDEATPKDEVVAYLHSLKNQGIIRAIGVSNFSLEQLKQANKNNQVDVVQDLYHLLDRKIEGAYEKYMLDHEIGFIPYSPLASGLLTGKYDLDTELPERLKKRPHFMPDRYKRNLQKIEVLKQIASQKEITVSQVVLAWYLTNPFITALIPGAKKVEQVMTNLKTADVVLTKQEIDVIDQTFR